MIFVNDFFEKRFGQFLTGKIDFESQKFATFRWLD